MQKIVAPLLIAMIVVFTTHAQDVVIKAIDLKIDEVPGFVPFYKDKGRAALAVNSIQYPDQWAAVQTAFEGPTGVYDLTLATLTEFDGEPSYKIRVQGRLVADYQHLYTGVDFQEDRATWKGVALEQGDILRVEANNASNGLVPEGDGFAYARGRWVQLEFRRTE
ncbi:hypothetical protein [Pleomorphovibrio marinus]|uniref:hypothetical protein n=1 Tax=Pleomorphovibrio marinus TaxID=2164132 RepID=UPI001300491B|nr:hypothetical protein [Pleomorphovibrio marinus]